MSEIPEAPPPASDPSPSNVGLGNVPDPMLAASPAATVPLGSDDEAVKKMSSRTSRFGRLAFGGMAIGALALVYWGYQRNEAYTHRADRLDEIGKIDDQAQMLAALRQELQNNPYDDVKQRIILNLGHFQDAEAVPLLARELDRPGVVRRSAARALAEIGLPAAEPAKTKLLAVLPKTDERDHAQVVWALAVLREQNASEQILKAFSDGLLQGLDGFEARVITEALGPSRLGSDVLINHEEESVRVLTAHALAEASSAEVVDPLSKLLTQELARSSDTRSTEVIRASAAGLGRTGDARAVPPLFTALGKEPSLRSTIVDALKRSVAAPGIEQLVKSAADVSLKRDLVGLLAATHDDRAADALVELLDHTELDIRATAALALAELGDERAAPALIALARTTEESNDDTMMANALTALRHVANESVAGELLGLLRDIPQRKALILRALGNSGSPSVTSTLAAELNGDDARAAALALADLGATNVYPQMKKLIAKPKNADFAARTANDRKLTNEPLLMKRKAAIEGVGRFGRSDAFDALMTVASDPADDYELRSLAAAAIGLTATDEQIEAVMQRLTSPETDDEARGYLMQALWQKSRPALGERLLELMKSETAPGVQRAAAIALGYSAPGQHQETLIAMLDNEDTRRAAAFAITLGGTQPAIAKLSEMLAKDNDLRDIWQTTLLNQENNWFNLLNKDMFASGAIWQRMSAALQLREGTGERSYGQAWEKAIAVLRSGWSGADGADPRFVRTQLWEAIAGEDEARRATAAAALAAIPELGLLLRARDHGGATAEAARSVLRDKKKKS